MNTRVTQFKAAVSTNADGLAPGQFEAVVAVFGNRDTYGDVIMPGAFTDTLKAWEESGDRIPVIWSHDWTDPFSHVGTAVEATETDQGLRIIGEITQEEQDHNPKAAQIYRLLKSRRVTQFSFAYDIEDGAEAEHDGQPVYELRKLKLLEVGPCLVGVNRETELMGIKSETMRKAITTALAEEREAEHETPPTAAPGGDEGETDPGETEPPSTADDPQPTSTPAGDQDPTGGADPQISLVEIELIEIEQETGEQQS